MHVRIVLIDFDYGDVLRCNQARLAVAFGFLRSVHVAFQQDRMIEQEMR